MTWNMNAGSPEIEQMYGEPLLVHAVNRSAVIVGAKHYDAAES